MCIAFLLSLLTCSLHAATVTSSLKQVSPLTITATITIKPMNGEVVYHDFISMSSDHPTLALSAWRSSLEPVNHYAPEFKATKLAYHKPFTLSLTLENTGQEKSPDAHLMLTYLSSAKKGAQQELFNIPCAYPGRLEEKKTPEPGPLCATKPSENLLPPAKPTLNPTTWSRYVEQLIRTSDILWVKILLITLLGLLMSFTPCIYPMIPITIGIMQGQGRRSLLQTFLHAFAYTMGIATTFACLGLIAAWTGTLFGMFLTHPLVILGIVSMLIYLAFSMFGLYELHIPSFLREGNRTHKGSLFSSFLFGAASGSVASPCLSPGLALVLCMVAALKSLLLGFVLLFAFGIGLGIPLLIIGTFSGSLTLLPQAGSWMVEVKKFFGFLLIGMSFYYLQNILPWWFMLWLFASLVAVIGIYYLYQAPTSTRQWKRIKNMLGIVFLASAVDLFVEAWQATFLVEQVVVDTFWVTGYEDALKKAAAEKKLMFLDFWTTSCSICAAIDKTLMKDEAVRKNLSAFIPTKIELSMADPVSRKLKERFNLVGVPTFILFDPIGDRVIKTWGGELYRYDKQQFIEELQQAAR